MMGRVVRTPTIHKKEIIMDKEKLKEILDSKGLEYQDFHLIVKKKYGLDLSYKGFMSLISNHSTWKLLYAHAISEVLGINYMDIFRVVDVDKDKVRQAKADWNRKYGKKKAE